MPEPALADMTAVDDAVFIALADPTRRRLIGTLLARESVTASALASELPMTRQAISKHLSTLAAAKLVTTERVGRETRYALTPAPLVDLAATLTAVGTAWERRLERLRDLVVAQAAEADATPPVAAAPPAPTGGGEPA